MRRVMHGLGALAVCTLLISAPLSMAEAADPPVKAVAPVATWNGFYVGGNIGYGRDFGSTSISAVSTDPVLAPALAAFTAGRRWPFIQTRWGRMLAADLSVCSSICRCLRRIEKCAA